MSTFKNNLFLEFQQKKQQVCELADAAFRAGWLDENAYKEILSKINEDVLVIGVIGQMKCGKSTFLNSFLFGQQLLPAATTPMTAALSVITYGEHKGIEAEFYSVNEWEELKSLSKRNENEVNDAQTQSSIKAAKELYQKSYILRDKLPNLLGKTQSDSFENLIEYVGADGKFVSIVKSVRITLPEEWLKGVEIVDTPGFNDPVVSREERTKDFLKRADVVLMMLYAGRAFDATDRDILFDKIRKVGIGKVILAVNKYDIQLSQGESPAEIKGFVVEELKKAIRQNRDQSVSELLEDIDPILISAQMALLAKMPMSQISHDEDLKYHFNKACEDFELTTQAQLLEMSRILDLENKVKDIISNQKEEILIRKPINFIFQKAQNELEEIEIKLTQCRELKSNLEMPDVDLQAKVVNLQKAQSRIKRKIEYAEADLGDAYDELSTKILRKAQDVADEAREDCERIINQYKRDNLSRKLQARLERFQERELPRLLQDSEKELKRGLDDNLYQLTEELENIIEKFLDNADELAEQFRFILKKGLDVNLGKPQEKEENNEENFTWGSVLGGVLCIPVWPIVGFFSLLDSGRDDARVQCDDFFSSIKWNELEYQLSNEKNRFIKTLNGDAALSLITGLTEQAEEAIGSLEEKEEKLACVKQKISDLESRKKSLCEEFNKLKSISPKV